MSLFGIKELQIGPNNFGPYQKSLFITEFCVLIHVQKVMSPSQIIFPSPNNYGPIEGYKDGALYS